MNTDYVQELIAALEVDDPDVYQTAAIELVEIGPSTIDALMSVSRHPLEHVRYIVIWALGEMGEERVLPVLMFALNDESSRVQELAIKALGEPGRPEVVPFLLEKLYSPDPTIRMSAAAALGWIGDERAVSGLIDMMAETEDPQLLSHIAEALGKLRNLEAVPVLIYSLRHPNDWVRMRAARSLGRLADARAVDGLIHKLGDRNEWVRYNAALALGEIGHPDALFDLVNALRYDPMPQVRRAAAIALGRIGDTRVIDVLREAMNDPEDTVLEAIDVALVLLGAPIRMDD